MDDIENAVLEMALTYKARGWRAILPRPRRPQNPAIVLIGNDHDGWTPILTLIGPDRFDRAQAVVDRYNTSPD